MLGEKHFFQRGGGVNLLEYQAKSLLDEFQIPTPKSVLIESPGDLARLNNGLFPSGYVVKAQVLAGARGKAGGIKIVKSLDEAKESAAALLGATLATRQTKGAALKIEAVLIAEKIDFNRSLYLAVTLDRNLACPSLLFSGFGGMEIEEVLKDHPNALAKYSLGGNGSFDESAFLKMAQECLSFDETLSRAFLSLVKKIIALYFERDLSLVEINPLVISGSRLVALDAKIKIDENALFRQAKNKSLADILLAKGDPLEKKAKDLGIAYIPIGGQIGCLVNGAGLAMATMDLIARYGLKPANFLDVGGGADLSQVGGAFEVLFSNPDLSAIFVNIFGGIMRCDVIAQALVQTNKILPLKVPLVARLKGTNMNEAHQILKSAQLSQARIFTDLDEAIKALVSAAKVVKV